MSLELGVFQSAFRAWGQLSTALRISFAENEVVLGQNPIGSNNPGEHAENHAERLQKVVIIPAKSAVGSLAS